jgi:hypothetical protein
VKHPVTPDRRDFVVRGRLWRMANPVLEEAERADLVGRLMAARRSVRDPTSGWTAWRKQPRTWPSTKSNERSANAVRRSGTTARRMSTGMWRRTLHMLTGTRALLASTTEDCELLTAASTWRARFWTRWISTRSHGRKLPRGELRTGSKSARGGIPRGCLVSAWCSPGMDS